MADFSRRAGELSEVRLVALFILAHTVVWTLMPTISRAPAALWDDMLETYSWAQHWQLGYYKHPPFYSWLTGLWFLIFPRTDWAFYLLSATNVGVGMVGIWLLARQFMKLEARLLALLLLTFMPYYNYMASNYNANTILLSLWPWTAYAFARTMATRSLVSAIAFGALAAICMLSKYYSILLLACCFAASLFHPMARRYYGSAAPYVAVTVAVVMMVPHAWWAIANDLPPVTYALGKTGQPWSYNFHKAVTTAVASVAMNSVAAIILIAALRWRRPAIFSGLWSKLLAREHWWILILATGPFALTILLGMAGYVKVAVNFLIPAFFMLPMIVTMALEPAITREAVAGVVRAVVIFLVGAVLIAPVIAYTSVLFELRGTIEVSPIAAGDAARLWREHVKVPLRIVAGSEKYSLAQPFYDAEAPDEFTHFNFDQSPWITRDRIRNEGLLSICDERDAHCLGEAARYANSRTLEMRANLSRTYAGLSGPVVPVVYILTPPE